MDLHRNVSCGLIWVTDDPSYSSLYSMFSLLLFTIQILFKKHIFTVQILLFSQTLKEYAFSKCFPTLTICKHHRIVLQSMFSGESSEID